MASPGSVTLWISELKGGGSAAAGLLWERYFHRVVQLARSRLRDLRRGAADEEDVALNAFASLCRGAGQGRFQELADRDDLWRLLVVLTVRKAIDLRRREKGAPEAEEPDLAQVLSREPTPDEAAQVADECRRLFDLLDDPELRSIALWKMDGHSNEDIAGRLGCVVRTVERRLGVIRSLWEGEISA
jgi:DNA-directed RNA polymerase specialized sigma24 family protein